MKIQLIKPEEAYPVRNEVLRPGRPIEVCYYPGDKAPTSFHLGAFDGETLTSIGTFHLEKHPEFSDEVQFRLRGMATRPQWQGKGIGSALLKAGEQVITTRSANLLWFYARQIAFNFYEENGFKFHGDMFDIPDIGPHKIMYKSY